MAVKVDVLKKGQATAQLMLVDGRFQRSCKNEWESMGGMSKQHIEEYGSVD